MCPTLCDPMDCSPSGSSVHAILSGRILEWAAISSSRGSSWPRGQLQSLASPVLAGWFFTTSTTWEAQKAYAREIFFIRIQKPQRSPWFEKISRILCLDFYLTTCVNTLRLSLFLLTCACTHTQTHTFSQMSVLPCIQFFIVRWDKT